MSGVRKWLYHFLSVVLLFSLLGLALSFSSKLAFTDRHQTESWLSQSNLYANFVDTTIKEGQKAAGSDPQSGLASLSDTAIQQAAGTAFPTSLLQAKVNTVVESNYDWLEGKTATPKFMVDLREAKQNFAQAIGAYVQMHLAGLPVCTDQQLAQLTSVDPLTISCRPANLDPKTVAAQVTQQVAESDDFLADPVITPTTINPNHLQQGTPYYQKLSQLPKLYQLSLKLPWIFGVLSLVSAVAVFWLAPGRRKGIRRIGIALAFSGTILIAIKFLSDAVFSRVEHRIFNETSVGQLQHALTDFAHRVEHQLVKVDLLFGIAFLALAAIIFAYLYGSRSKTRHQPPDIQEQVALTEVAREASSKPTPQLGTPKPKKPTKPSRLIQ